MLHHCVLGCAVNILRFNTALSPVYRTWSLGIQVCRSTLLSVWVPKPLLPHNMRGTSSTSPVHTSPSCRLGAPSCTWPSVKYPDHYRSGKRCRIGSPAFAPCLPGIITLRNKFIDYQSIVKSDLRHCIFLCTTRYNISLFLYCTLQMTRFFLPLLDMSSENYVSIVPFLDGVPSPLQSAVVKVGAGQIFMSRGGQVGGVAASRSEVAAEDFTELWSWSTMPMPLLLCFDSIRYLIH